MTPLSTTQAMEMILLLGSGKDVLKLSDVTPSQFSEGLEVHKKGKSVEIADLMKVGGDLSSIKIAGTITGPDGEEISFKALGPLVRRMHHHHPLSLQLVKMV